MINALGSLSLIWLILWCLLTLAFSVVYPLFRPLFTRQLHPAHGSGLLLLYWAAPVVLAFLASLMLFSPLSEDLLVAPHCHGSCAQHSPQTSELSVALLGLSLAIVFTAGLLGSLLLNIWRGARMRRQFDALAVKQPGYSLLNASEPVVFTLGWWAPHVFISRGLLQQCSSEQLSVILLHEQAHRMRRDNLRLLLARVFNMVLPAGMRRQAMHDLQILCEQACDFESAKKHGATTVAETLVHVGRLVKKSSRPAGSMAFDGGDLSVRVHALLNIESRRTLRSWQLLMVVVVVAYVLLLTLDPLHHAAEWMIGLLDSIGVRIH